MCEYSCFLNPEICFTKSPNVLVVVKCPKQLPSGNLNINPFLIAFLWTGTAYPSPTHPYPQKTKKVQHPSQVWTSVSVPQTNLCVTPKFQEELVTYFNSYNLVKQQITKTRFCLTSTKLFSLTLAWKLYVVKDSTRIYLTTLPEVFFITEVTSWSNVAVGVLPITSKF